MRMDHAGNSSGRWALVTGASSGLGIEFARAMAARGINPVLAARSEEPMRRLADELRAQHNIEVAVEPVDLSTPDGPAALIERLDARRIAPDILINNAAFGLGGAFAGQDVERLRAMLQLDVMALTELTHAFAGRMLARGRGHILLVASMAAYQPTPLLAAYGAAKAFVLSLGEALHVELAPAVGVTVLSPGLMDTGFNAASGYQPPESARRALLAPSRVAAVGIDAMFKGRPSVVAGRLNRAMALATRLTSRHQQARMVFRMSGAGSGA